MTVMQEAYQQARATGLGHHAALRSLAQRYKLDKDTVARVLRRADKGRG